MNFQQIHPLGEWAFSFTQNGLVCAYDPCKKLGDWLSAITFDTDSGATVRLVYSNCYESVTAYVNEARLWTGNDTRRIGEPKLRAVVEAGMAAWALESVAAAARTEAARIAALKSL